MSNVAIKGGATGTATYTIEAPTGNTDRTLVLPDEAGTVLTSASSITSIADFEEGTWTPVVAGATTAGTTTAGSFSGRYTRIGNTATVWFSCRNYTLSGAVGALRVNLANLPSALRTIPSDPGRYFGSAAFYETDLVNSSSYTIARLRDDNVIDFAGIVDNGAWVIMDVENSSGLYLEGSVTYPLTGHAS